MSIDLKKPSKLIHELLSTPPGSAVSGLNDNECKKLRRQVSVIVVADSMVDIMRAHPEWNVHRYHGDQRTWSFNVGAATRLLMEWDADRKEVSNLRFHNPH